MQQHVWSLRKCCRLRNFCPQLLIERSDFAHMNTTGPLIMVPQAHH